MIKLKNEMIAILKKLKNEYFAIGVKADFEAEGTTLEELIFLNQIVNETGLNLFIKIGGCEAVFDLQYAKLFSASAIMVPMIETVFALKKFINATRKILTENSKVQLILNAETTTCANNFNEILNYGSKFLNGVTIGRVDLVNSLNLNRSDIDSLTIFNISEKFFNLAKEKKLIVSLGGGVGNKSFSFLEKIKFNRFETRKIIFSNSHNLEQFKKSICLATEFELCCLNFKQNYFNSKANEDIDRINLLKQRLQCL